MENAKFKIGQQIWFMFMDRPHCEQVCTIKIKAKPISGDGNLYEFGEPQVYYQYWDCDCPSDDLSESDCYATKEELKAAVFGDAPTSGALKPSGNVEF